jgi:hypothetical protein
MAAASAIRHAVNHSIRTQFRNPHKLFFSPPTLLMSAMASDRRFSYNGLKNFNGYGTKTPFLIAQNVIKFAMAGMGMTLIFLLSLAVNSLFKNHGKTWTRFVKNLNILAVQKSLTLLSLPR